MMYNHPQRQQHQQQPQQNHLHHHQHEQQQQQQQQQQQLLSTSSSSSGTTRHLVGALNTRKIGTKHHIRLPKSADGGFGIKIAERDNMFGSNRPIYVTAITKGGSAFRDGRLKEGDMLLEVNGVDLAGKSQHEVTRALKTVGINEVVDFVVSRQEDDSTCSAAIPAAQNHNFNSDCENDKSLIDLDVPDQEEDQIEERIDNILSQYVFNIPLNDAKSAGLGLYLKKKTENGIDHGIWIEQVITGGAAYKDGRLQRDDQILAINGINLVNLSNEDAFRTLREEALRGIGPETVPNTIRLKIYRKGPDNKTEHSDLLTNGHSITYLSDNNSTNSPQTQASTSLKLSNSCNDKTNDSSSAISQITEFTSLPDKGGDDESSIVDGTAEEERFQRDGFGRQSISEKRHAQLNAKNTDTYKRNQSMREERERQRQLELQLERQRLAEEKRYNSMLFSNMHRYSMSHHDHREVPVDVQLPLEQYSHNHPIQQGSSSGRIVRNRRMNESFRAAVDRSYDGSEIYTIDRSRFNFIRPPQQQQATTNTNSTKFTPDDKGSAAPPKKTSLLTKFLRFGSMKHDKKNKRTNEAEASTANVQKPSEEPPNLSPMRVVNGWQLPPPHINSGLWVLPIPDARQNIFATHNPQAPYQQHIYYYDF